VGHLLSQCHRPPSQLSSFKNSWKQKVDVVVEDTKKAVVGNSSTRNSRLVSSKIKQGGISIGNQIEAYSSKSTCLFLNDLSFLNDDMEASLEPNGKSMVSKMGHVLSSSPPNVPKEDHVLFYTWVSKPHGVSSSSLFAEGIPPKS
jgi:hypothetical protein